MAISLPSTSTAPLVVIGDSLLDVDLSGTATRLCPGEPAPVLERPVESPRPGGAALAAALVEGERPVLLVTALGRDADADRLRHELEGTVDLLDLGRTSTVVKTRIRAGNRTIARVDRGNTGEAAFGPCDAGELTEILRGAGGILASDYGLGILGLRPVRQALAAVAGEVPVVWDPHPRGASPVPGVSVATPNEDEASVWARIASTGLESSIQQARKLAQTWQCEQVAVTRGAHGVTVAGQDGLPWIVPATRVSDADTCGAGDAFAAAMVVALAAGHGSALAAELAVARATTFVERGGASGYWGQQQSDLPLADPDDADGVVAAVRAAGGTVVLAGGCFDLLHAGHIAYLEAARRLGDCLVVAINSDSSVRDLKGPDRPLVAAEDRRRVLQSLRCVDAVEIFHEATPAAVIERLRPDIFAKGGDYTEATLPEAGLVRGLGGQVVLLPMLSGRSSTRLVEAARTAGTARKEQECAQPRTA